MDDLKIIDYEKVRHYSRKDFARSLEHYRRFCDFLHLIDFCRVIIITGSSGKGSTAQIASEILTEHGFRVGLYTSPHLVHVTERIRINGRPITLDRYHIYRYYISNEIKLFNAEFACDYVPTFFELLTLIALFHFKQEKTDFAVLEVGLGGRLDATNIHHPVLNFILPVCREHTAFLGRTEKSILKEKQEVIRGKSVTVTSIRDKGLLRILEKKCASRDSSLAVLGRDFRVELKSADWNRIRFAYGSGRGRRELTMKLVSADITENAGMVLYGLGKVIRLDGAKTGAALKRITIPCRFQAVRRRLIVDGGHNILAVDSFVKTVKRLGAEGLDLIFTVMSDKKAEALLKRLSGVSRRLILVRLNMEREYDAGALFRIAKKYFREIIPARDLKTGLSLVKNRKAAVIGSFYLAGEALRILKGSKGA